VHLAHPLGVKMFSYRRVKNDQRDAHDLADLLRMGRLPQAWIAPPAVRELRELVRHRAKLVALRSNVKCQVHAVLAGAGVLVGMSDLFGAGGQQLLEKVALAPAMRARVNSCSRLIETLNFEVEVFTDLATRRLAGDPGYRAIQALPGVGRVLAAVLVAEIGQIDRFARPAQLACWAGLTPRHHESDTTVVRHHRAPRPHLQARQPPGPLGRGRGRSTSPREQPAGAAARPHRRPPRPQHWHRGRRPGIDRAGLLRATRSSHSPAEPDHAGSGATGVNTAIMASARSLFVMTPSPAVHRVPGAVVLLV
jgi:hypothetical protein